MKSILWSSMDTAALLQSPGFWNLRKKVTLPKKFAKSYLITSFVHRVGKPDEQAAAVVKDRQIIVGLSDPVVKFGTLKCGKNLKENPEYRHAYINEDLTVKRSTICYYARLLVKRRKAEHVWTTIGTISLKDNTGEIHNISTKVAFLTPTRQTNPSFMNPDHL